MFSTSNKYKVCTGIYLILSEIDGFAATFHAGNSAEFHLAIVQIQNNTNTHNTNCQHYDTCASKGYRRCRPTEKLALGTTSPYNFLWTSTALIRIEGALKYKTHPQNKQQNLVHNNTFFS